MSKMKRPRTILDKAILIGYTQEGECVYNAAMSLDKYYDDEHPWDSSEQVLALRLHRVHGYLFGTDGILNQEFESIFDLESGIFAKGWARHSDGTFQEH